MTATRPLGTLLRDHKTIFILLAVGLFLLELEIFALAAMKSGRQARLEVYNAAGHLIYETDGQNLSKFNRYYFEKTFGPLEQHEVRLVRRDRPFPFRAWFVAAVGIPLGVVLLFAFLVKAFQSLFVGAGQEGATAAAGGADAPDNRLERVVGQFSRLNVFALGALVLLAVLAYWILPNAVAYLGRVGLETVLRFRWFLLGAALLAFALVVWIVYLRYLLARKTIESRTELDKYRLQLEFAPQSDSPPLLECPPSSEPPLAERPGAAD